MKIGITALIPPEIIYSCGHLPVDINNKIPLRKSLPWPRLCAWSASWRDMLIKGEININQLVIVAGGDCHNTIVDGQLAEKSGIPSHYFFYPMDNDEKYLLSQIEKLIDFLSGIKDESMFAKINDIKDRLIKLDRERYNSKLLPEEFFSIMISASDLMSSPDKFIEKIKELENRNYGKNNEKHTLGNEDVFSVKKNQCLSAACGSEHKILAGIIGVPAIMHDMHKAAYDSGLKVVYDELPWEFIRLKGKSVEEVALNYLDYSFSKKIDRRIEIIREEIDKRKLEALIHYTQYSCHHTLEDELLRKAFDVPVITIQGDVPGKVNEQGRLRLEAFYEMLMRK